MSSESRVAAHKAQVGRQLKGLPIQGIYHNKQEILILRTDGTVVRYLPFSNFKVIAGDKTYTNVSLPSLSDIVKQGKLSNEQ